MRLSEGYYALIRQWRNDLKKTNRFRDFPSSFINNFYFIIIITNNKFFPAIFVRFSGWL